MGPRVLPWSVHIGQGYPADRRSEFCEARLVCVLCGFGAYLAALNESAAERQHLPKTVVTYKVLKGGPRYFFTSKLLILISDAEFLVHNAVPTISFLKQFCAVA